MEQPAKNSQVWRGIQICGCCLLWLSCSTAIVLVNRAIVLEEFRYPIALSALGQTTSFICSAIIVSAANAQERASPGKDVAQRPAMTGVFWATRVVPVGIAQAFGIWISNLLYLLMTVAFIEMARSLMPLLTLLALWGTKLKIPDQQQIAAVLLSAVGCAISAYGEARLVPLGVFCLALSFGMEIVRMLLLQYLMQNQQLGPWQTVLAISGPASVTLLMLMVSVEGAQMLKNNAGATVVKFWPAFLLAAFLGVASSWITNIVIQLSSATTVKLLAAVRGPLIVLSGMMIYAEKVATLQLLGYSIALVGFVWYSLAPGVTTAQSQLQNQPNPQLKVESPDTAKVTLSSTMTMLSPKSRIASGSVAALGEHNTGKDQA